MNYIMDKCISINCFELKDGVYTIIGDDMEDLKVFNENVKDGINSEIASNLQESELVPIIVGSGKYVDNNGDENGEVIDIPEVMESDEVEKIIPSHLTHIFQELDKSELPFKHVDNNINGSYIVNYMPYTFTSLTSTLYSRCIEGMKEVSDDNITVINKYSISFVGYSMKAVSYEGEVRPLITVLMKLYPKDNPDNGLGVMYTAILRGINLDS